MVYTDPFLTTTRVNFSCQKNETTDSLYSYEHYLKMDALSIVILHWIREENLVRQRRHLEDMVTMRHARIMYKQKLGSFLNDDASIHEMSMLCRFLFTRKCIGGSCPECGSLLRFRHQYETYCFSCHACGYAENRFRYSKPSSWW